MGKGIDKILGFMKLNDSEYSEEDEFEEFDDEYDEDEDELEEEEEELEPPSRSAKRSSSKRRSSDDSYDDIDDEEPPARTGFLRRPFSGTSSDTGSRQRSGRGGSKVVHMNGRSTRSGMEVRVVRPVDFESYCQEISDIILENKAAIINFEDVKKAGDAQRIIDFVSGACYAIDGSVKQIAENIVVVAPYDIDVSGDFLEENESAGVSVPEFGEEDPDPLQRRSYEM